jgi:hypothetical protein
LKDKTLNQTHKRLAEQVFGCCLKLTFRTVMGVSESKGLMSFLGSPVLQFGLDILRKAQNVQETA